MRRVITIEVSGQVQWEIAKASPDGNWVAICRPLALTMEGDSLDELHQNIQEAVQLLMEDLMENGELEQFLRARGWNQRDISPQRQGPVHFDVPYELLVKRDSTRALLQ